MKRVIDVLYGLRGYPNSTRFTEFKTDLFANGSTPAITMDTATTNGITVSGATTTAIRVTGNATTALAVLTGTFTTGLSIAAATTGISLSGTKTTGILISDTVATAINLTCVSATAAISISGADAIGVRLSGAFTTAAIDITTTSSRAIRVGTKGTTYANSTALQITSIGGTLDTDPARNYLVGVFSKVVEDEETSATDDLGCAWFRTRMDKASTTPAGYSIWGVRSQLRIYSDTALASTVKNWAAAGMMGVLEVSGATTTFSSGCVAAAVFANVALTTTSVIASGAVVAGVVINSGSAAITNTGSAYYGLYIEDYVGTNVDFNAGVKIANSVCTIGVDVGTCTSVLNVAATATQVINVAAAGNVTAFASFNAIAGCVTSADVNPKDTPSAGGLGADGAIKILINGQDYWIPIFAIELT